MSTRTQGSYPNYESFLKLISDPKRSYAVNPGIRIATKRSKHSAKLAERIQTNAEIAEQLIATIKALVRIPGTANQVDKLIDTVEQLINNNAKLREQVGEALQDIPH